MSNLGHVNGVKISREFAPPSSFGSLFLFVIRVRARASSVCAAFHSRTGGRAFLPITTSPPPPLASVLVHSSLFFTLFPVLAQWPWRKLIPLSPFRPLASSLPFLPSPCSTPDCNIDACAMISLLCRFACC